jgi:hypothetical protein
MTAPDELDVAEASAASEGQRLMISQRMEADLDAAGRPTELFTGRWVAAGAIDDEGTATITQTQVTQQPSGTALVVATHVLASRVDPTQTLELESRTTLRPFPPQEPNRRVLVEGTWRLVEATKDYANLRARGRLFATITDREVDENQEIREITLVRDGSARSTAS